MTKKILLTFILILLTALISNTVSAQSKPKEQKKEDTKTALLGKWKSSEARVEFINKNTLTINGVEYRYAVIRKTIVVQYENCI